MSSPEANNAKQAPKPEDPQLGVASPSDGSLANLHSQYFKEGGPKAASRAELSPTNSHQLHDVQLYARAELPKTDDNSSKHKLPPTEEHYEKGGQKWTLFHHATTVPIVNSKFHPTEKRLDETFPAPFGVKDPTKDFGGVLVGENTSRTISRYEKTATADGRDQWVIELKDMKGFHGYGKLGPIKDHRELHAVKMWQEQTGVDKSGQPVYSAFKEPVIREHDWLGRPKKELTTQAIEPMSNAEFNQRWNELDPKHLQQLANSNNRDNENPEKKIVRR